MSNEFVSATGRLSSKGSVVLPKAIRDALGVRPGEEVQFTFWPSSLSASGSDELHVRRVSEDPVAATAGILKGDADDTRSWTQEIVEEHRREVEQEEREIEEQRKKRRRSA